MMTLPRAEAALGVRIALRSGREGRVRVAMVALASAIGTTAVLAVIAMAAADEELHPDRYADGTMTRLTLLIVAVVAVQAAGLAAVAARLSTGLRVRRLAALRLLGSSASRTRLVAAVEPAMASALGTVVGCGAFWLCRPLLSRVRIAGQRWAIEALAPGVGAMVLVPMVVVLATVVVAVAPERLDTRSALGVARGGQGRTSRLTTALRIVPLLLGAGSCAWLRVAAPEEPPIVVVIGSILALATATVVVIPLFVRAAGAALHRVAPGPGGLMAARRLQAQPSGVNRVVTGLLVGLFLVTSALSVLVAFQGTPQYRGAARQAEIEQLVQVTAAPELTAGARAAILDTMHGVDGVRRVIDLPLLTASCGAVHANCASAVVATCAELEAVAADLQNCRDGVPLWLTPVAASFPPPPGTPLEWMPIGLGPSDTTARLVLPAPADRVAGDDAGRLASVILPPDQPGLAALAERTARQLVVLGDPGRDLADRLAATLDDPDGHLGTYVVPWSASDYDLVQAVRSVVLVIGSLVVGMGLLSFALAVVDRAVNRRRELLSLQLLGVPSATLRRSQWIEAAVPVLGGAALALGFGGLAGDTYLGLADEPLSVPWGALVVLAAATSMGGVVVATITAVASTTRISPDAVRGV